VINLLPSEIKIGYRYARRNVQLRRWVLAFVVALVGLGALATYGLLTLHQSSVSYANQVSGANKQLQLEQLSQTNKQVQNISNSLKLSVKVLSQEVLFSKLITQIGAVMPSGAILTDLDIDKVSGGLDLTANTTNYNTGTQVQVNLAAPANKIFATVDIDSVTCDSKNSVNSSYPCTVTLRALFNTNNQFLFINQGAKS
jgi:hypothetical protein